MNPKRVWIKTSPLGPMVILDFMETPKTTHEACKGPVDPMMIEAEPSIASRVKSKHTFKCSITKEENNKK